MELTDLRHFQAVARARSFVRGARARHVSPPAVSKAVKKLEAELGQALFKRSTRHVTLTPAGALLLERCRKIFDELDLLHAELELGASTPRGELSIAAMEVFSIQLLPQALAMLVGEHPAVVPVVHEMIPEKMLAAIGEDRLDLGFSIGARSTERVECEPLGRSRGILICGRSHPLYTQGRVRARDLREHPSVVPRFWEAESLPPLDQFPEDRFFRRIGARIELLQMELALVLSGKFLGFVPEITVAEELAQGRLKALRGIDFGVDFELSLMSRRGSLQKPAARILIRHVRELMRRSSRA